MSELQYQPTYIRYSVRSFLPDLEYYLHLIHSPRDYPLPWCFFAVLPGYHKALAHLCAMPADHVYEAGFRTKADALAYAKAEDLTQIEGGECHVH